MSLEETIVFLKRKRQPEYTQTQLLRRAISVLPQAIDETNKTSVIELVNLANQKLATEPGLCI